MLTSKRLAGIAALVFSFSVGALALAPSAKEARSAEPASTPATGDLDAALPSNMRLGLQRLGEGGGQAGADLRIQSAQAIVRQNLQKDDAWVLLGRAWVQKARESNDPGFYLNAEACASVVLERDPDHVMALDLRGLVLLNAHKFTEAKTLADAIVAKHPEDPMAWGTSSDALLELGRYDEAAAAAQTMVDLKPNLPSYSRASHLKWLHGEVSDAKATVRAAIDAGRDRTRDPEPGAWVLVQAAMIFWHEGDYEGAEAGFDRAIERIPDYAPANVGKGRVAMARGDARRASELFERAYASSPLVETAWLLVDAREALADHEGAQRARERVEHDGRLTDPRTLSLFWSTRNENTVEALRLAREEYALRKDIVTEDALAWALYRSGELNQAKASILRARRLGTPDARLLYHEGAILLALGEDRPGKALISRALAQNPAFDATAVREARALTKAPLAVR